MARIDDLISQIPDKQLRQRLDAALADMKKRQRFGLVFEEHVPETVALPGLPIQPGATVQLRSDPDGRRLYRVREVSSKGRVTLESGESSQTEEAQARDLLVVKRFGDPIFPALTPLGAVRRGATDQPHHAVINGENFHTLQLLVYLYEGQVDCIYIDPPYNTGARDWKYNNHYVDSNDAWRHSKWLSFMEKRLKLAKRLLRPDGVLICTIDEHEVHHLGMLLERVFPAPTYSRSMITIVINPKGTGADNFARVEEYACFVGPASHEYVAHMPFGFALPLPPKKDSRRVVLPADQSDVEEGDEESEKASGIEPVEERHFRKLALRRDGAESSHRSDRPRQFYAIYIREKTNAVLGIGPELRVNDQIPEERRRGVAVAYPIDPRGEHRVWRYGRDTMKRLIAKGEIQVTRKNPKTGTYSLYHVKPIDAAEAERRKPRTVWWHPSHDAGAHGSSLLNLMLGERAAFPFPKSVYAVRDCLKLVVGNRPNALILDFFAGSGTTTHATFLLNAEDGGSRRSVIITNNEVEESVARKLQKDGVARGDAAYEQYGIFEAVTVPRVKTAITGIRPDGSPIPPDKVYAHLDGRPMAGGLAESVEFFRVDYLDPDDVDLGGQFAAIFPSLWLAAGGIGVRPKLEDEDMLVAPGAPYAVLFREQRFKRFLKVVTGRTDLTHVWLVTDSEDAFAEMRAMLDPHLKVSMLYRDYLRNFKINTRQNL